MSTAVILAILVGAVILFVTEAVSVDLVALLVVGALLVTGVATPTEAFAGFADPATLTIAAMYVLSAGLEKTGAVRIVALALVRLARTPWLQLLTVMGAAAALSAFVNNTAAVAVLLPSVLRAAARRGTAPSRLLIPLSYASQFGGVCTLVGTSTNLVVNSVSAESGRGGFSMFEFAPLGLILAVTGTAYFLLVGRWVLPTRFPTGRQERYGLTGYLAELRVRSGSRMIGSAAAADDVLRAHDVEVIAVLHERESEWTSPSAVVRAGDLLHVRGSVADILAALGPAGLEMVRRHAGAADGVGGEPSVLAEMVVSNGARVVGSSLSAVRFADRHGVVVLAVRRRGRPVQARLGDLRLEVGDALLVHGPRARIAAMHAAERFIVLDEVEEPSRHHHKAPRAALIVAAAVALAAFHVLPIVISALLGCVAMALLRCVEPEEAYASVDWKVIVLIAGMLPLGAALEKCGAASLIASWVVQAVGPLGPTALLAALYGVTALLTEFMSNTASAALLAPIAVSAADALGVEARPFLVAVTFAASTSFATPVGYQTNTMVYEPGGYRYTDFTRAGLPLNLLFLAISVFVIPRLWPF